MQGQLQLLWFVPWDGFLRFLLVPCHTAQVSNSSLMKTHQHTIRFFLLVLYCITSASIWPTPDFTLHRTVPGLLLFCASFLQYWPATVQRKLPVGLMLFRASFLLACCFSAQASYWPPSCIHYSKVPIGLLLSSATTVGENYAICNHGVSEESDLS